MNNLSLNQFDSKEIIVEKLKEVFESFYLEFQSLEILENIPCLQLESHKKYILKEEETPLGNLIFEYIIFSPGIPTGAHIHPHFIVDKIIEGKMLEIRYHKEDACYEKSFEQVRIVGDERALYCKECLPHNVMAIDKPCKTFNLSLGNKKVEGIQIG